MFDRFSDKAKRSMNCARLAAQEFNHDYIAPEHMLLGVLSVEDCQATKILAALGATPDALATALRSLMKPAEGEATYRLPFTASGKRVLELSMQTASTAGHVWIGTEHILVGIAESESEPARRALRAHDLTPQRLLDQLLIASAVATEGQPGAPSKALCLRQAMAIATEAGDLKTAARLLALLERIDR